MRFGVVASAGAEGSILAHGVKLRDGAFKKGRVLSAADVQALQADGISSVTVAQLDADDVPEDEAARRLALAISGEGVRPQQAFTGRANIHSVAAGVLLLDAERINAINQLHESLTVATLPAHARVAPRAMLATVKVIPFAVPRPVLEAALAMAAEGPLITVAAFRPVEAGLVITQLPQTKASLVQKSEHAMAERLQALGARLVQTRIVPHEDGAVADAIATLHEAGASPILVFGASAIVDRADVVPHGLALAGGEVEHLGMPVDPGNLAMIGRLVDTPVIGVPSCARSPKVNGFDWILERVVAGVPVSRADVMAMGVGGLLAEIPSRPAPRESLAPAAPRISAIVLAAGLSRRMGGNKMLAEFEGQPMVRATVQQVLASSVDEVIVVTGHEPAAVAAALEGLPVRLVQNADYAQGLSTSLRAGVAAATGADAVLVCLGDMPRVSPATMDRLIAAYNPVEHRSIVVPTHHGTFGNPVLWGQEHFARFLSLSGDKGARSLISDLKAEATEVEAADRFVLMDADTPEALAALRQGS